MEERKVQIAVDVDGNPAKQGFQEIGRSAVAMGQTVERAGEQGEKGLKKIGEGATRSAAETARAEGAIRASMQRATLELNNAGKSLSQKFEAKIDFKGLNVGNFQKDLADLKQAEAAQLQAQSDAKATAFVDGLKAEVAALQEKKIALEGGAEALLRYKAAQVGAADAEPLISQVGQLKTEIAAKAEADAKAAAAAKAEAAAVREQAAAQEAFLASLRSQRDQAATANLSPADQQRARAAQLGVSEQAEPIIAQTAAAQNTAAAQAFIASLKQQSELIGKSRTDLLTLRAAELGVADAAGPMIAKLAEADKTAKGFGATGKLNSWQLQQVAFQLHDFGVQALASGGNLKTVVTAFVQQGSQLSGTFDGAGNAFKAVMSLLTPMRAGMLAAAGGVIALGAAMASVESKTRALNTIQAQFAGTGRAGMFSTKELNDFINQLALLPNVSRATATAVVSELSKVHDIGAKNFKELASLAVDYAKATGTDIPTATKALAQAFSGSPVQGAKALDQALGTLTSSQLLAIERMERLGDVAGARRVMLDALKQSVQGLADNALTPLQTSLKELGNAWERAMQSMDRSDGLRRLNELLGKTVQLVTWLVEHAEEGAAKMRPLLAIATLGGSEVARALLKSDDQSQQSQVLSRVSSGRVGGVGASAGPGTGDFARADRAAAAANPASVGEVNRAADDQIKRGLELAASHRSEAGQIKDLTEQRTSLNRALAESNRLYGANSEQSQRLRDGISGINKQISSLGKGQGVLDAQLQAKIKEAQNALQAERDALAFTDKYLQGAYQQGGLSLVDLYDQKRQAIERGTAAEIAALEKERKAVQEHLAKSRDPDKKEQDRTRLKEIDSEEEKARIRGARDQVTATQELDLATQQLNEQLLNYRSNLRQLAGDEAGAARLRNQIADQQDKILAAQAAKIGKPLSEAELAAAKRGREQQVLLNDAKTKTSAINQLLQIQEERIAFAQEKGNIGEIEALTRQGAARAAMVSKLEEQLRIKEKLSQELPDDLQLKVDVEGFRFQIEQLKASLDPLKEKFDSIFKDAGSNLFSDLMNGTKPRDALRNFANSITKPINDMIGKDLSASIFGQGGKFGGLGGMFADLFGGKNRVSSPVNLGTVTGKDMDVFFGGEAAQKAAGAAEQAATVAAQTAAVTASTAATTAQTAAVTTETAGLTGATAALTALTAAAQAAATALATVGTTGGAGGGAGALGSLLGAGGGGAVNLGTSTGADAMLFWSSGGYTGDKGESEAAGVVHGKEFVFSAPAVRTIGRDVLETIHARAKGGDAGALGSRKDVPGYQRGGFVEPGTVSTSVFNSIGGDSHSAVSSTVNAPHTDASSHGGVVTVTTSGGQNLTSIATNNLHAAPHQAVVVRAPAAPSLDGSRPVLVVPASGGAPAAQIARQTIDRIRESSTDRSSIERTDRTLPGYNMGGLVVVPSSRDTTREVVSERIDRMVQGYADGGLVVVTGTDRERTSSSLVERIAASDRESSVVDRSERTSDRITQLGGRDTVSSIERIVGPAPLFTATERGFRDGGYVTERERFERGFSVGGYTGDIDTQKAAGVVHGQEYVFSAPAVRALGVDRLERLHEKAKRGRLEDEGIPGYADGGYVAFMEAARPLVGVRTQYLTAAPQPAAQPAQPVKTGDTHYHNYTVNAQAMPGVSRATAMQQGRDIQRGLEAARRRNG